MTVRNVSALPPDVATLARDADRAGLRTDVALPNPDDPNAPAPGLVRLYVGDATAAGTVAAVITIGPWGTRVLVRDTDGGWQVWPSSAPTRVLLDGARSVLGLGL